MSEFTPGDYNVLCDVCGKKRLRSQCKKTWDGYLACTIENCWYPKHPADEPLILPQEDISIQDGRPRPTLTYTRDLQGISIWGGVLKNSFTWSTTLAWTAMDGLWDQDYNSDADTSDIPLR